MNRTLRRATAVAFSGMLLLGGVACSDEDGDGATTDEEIQDVEDQVDEEIQGQDEGSNQDDE
ncbi:MAG TPA: hypothetical protein VF640_10380 [Acidimicrobiales bacterium]|jgi:hypothetical protein